MKPQNAPDTNDGDGAANTDLKAYPSRTARVGKSVQRGVFRAILGLGWLSFALIAVATIIEHHPNLERWIADAVAERVEGPLGQKVEIDDVDVLWLKRSVAITGLSMGPSAGVNPRGGGAEVPREDPRQGLMARQISLRFGWSLTRGVYADRVDVDGGSILLSESMSRGLQDSGSESEGSTVDLLAQSPEVALRDFAIALALPGGRTMHLGTANVSLTQPSSEATGSVGTRISGRFTPSLRIGEFGDPPPQEDGQGNIWISGTVGADRIARVSGVARSLALSLEPVGDIAPVSALARFEPRARLDLTLEATYELDHSVLPAVAARIQMREGSLVLPWLEGSRSRPVTGVDLLAEVGFDPEGASDALDPSAWSAGGTLTAQWEELEGNAAFRAGTRAPQGSTLEVWVDIPGAPLGERLSELAAGQEGIVELDRMLAPEGSADVSIGVRIPTVQVPDQPVSRSLERLILIRARGDASLAYHGGIDRRTGRRDIGFPLPVRRVVGDVTWSIRPEGRFPGQLAFYDMSGTHSGGPVDVQGSLHFTPIWRFADESLIDLVPTPFHLVVTSQRLPLDRDFETAMRGLYGVPEVAELIPTWSPGGGTLDLQLELWRTVDRRELSMDLDTTLAGVGFRWRELPIPIEGATGSLRIQTDGGGPERGRALVQFDLEATTPIAREPLHVHGRVAGQGAPEGNARSVSWIEVDARRVNGRSPELREELARKSPDAAASLDATGVSGFVDLFLTAVQPLPSLEAAALRASLASPDTGELPGLDAYLGGMEIHAEIRPNDSRGGLSVQPTQFPIITREVQGRLLATALMPPEVLPDPSGPDAPHMAMSAAIQGQWRQVGPSVPIVSRITTSGDGPVRLSAFGAGLDIANRSLVGSLTNAARAASSAEGGMDPVDTDGIDVAGRVDFAAAFTLPEAPGLPTTDSVIGVEARLDKLGVGGSQILRDVSAHFRFDAATEEWIGEEIDARLGETAIQLSGLVYQPEPDGSTLRARLSARGLPIDREHLSFFLDEETLRTVLDDLRASGTFDIDGAWLELTERRDGTRHVELDGQIRIEDAFINLGAPIEVALIESMDLHLNHEGKELRSRATIDGLFGAIAGRRLENARMQMTYVGQRLVIEAFDGGFEGGRLRALGSDVARGADLFAMDLKAPFPFRLAAQMSTVDIGEFLRGVFDSNFANRGEMDLSMRLAGDFEHLIEMRGGGKITIRDSALWAIPVFQALSQRLGIDTTVLFRELICEYTIEDGALLLDRMRVDSDLLSLVGSASMTFEGDVTSDLEVRYRLVDALGPLTRLLYRIQNSLLRVSVRGTMDRPTVVLRGLISQFFAPSDERDRLPLPGFSERPARF
ncbi:hypothetical protein Poly30_17950 [Planctomycetes bacterium Poly30]|uniref:Uncharacterized protein n=1 Tax=Saltatorellus ferox TaxID=2528018 RepID=A0A518EQB9_9BACT|nr:hypothetical protein Poly30_17950 [Planctomycetes bacterium Poly30]